MPFGRADSQRLASCASRGSSRCGMVTLSKLNSFQPKAPTVDWKTRSLVQVHNLETFGTQYGHSCLEEYEIERFRWQEEISVNPEPFRLGRAQT
jgi:hypothetical protein